MPVELYATTDQIEIINSNARFMGLFAGRRWGKTDTWFNRCAKRMLERPIEYMYIAPGYPLAKEQHERFCDGLRPFLKRQRSQPKPEAWLTNGSHISFRSFDKPKFIRGSLAHEVWVDEIQDINEVQFWPILRPLISDYRGTLVVSGQFRGHNWYYEQFFLKGQKPNQNLYRSWKKPSSTGLRFQDEAGIEELRIAAEQLPRAMFLQEYECEPIANQSAVFVPEDLSAIKRGAALPGPIANRHYIAAYDLGEMIDHSALVIFEYETNTIVHAEQVPLRTKHEMQAKKLADTVRRWGASCVIDGTGGGTGGQRSANENVKFYRQNIPDLRVMMWAPGVKRELVREASLAIEGHKINVPAEFIELHRQLAAYEFERKGEDYVYHAAKGAHDDQVAALMMAVHAARAGWVRTTTVTDVSSLY